MNKWVDVTESLDENGERRVIAEAEDVTVNWCGPNVAVVIRDAIFSVITAHVRRNRGDACRPRQGWDPNLDGAMATGFLDDIQRLYQSEIDAFRSARCDMSDELPTSSQRDSVNDETIPESPGYSVLSNQGYQWIIPPALNGLGVTSDPRPTTLTPDLEDVVTEFSTTTTPNKGR